MGEQIVHANMGQIVIRKETYEYPTADEITSLVPDGDRIVSLSVAPRRQTSFSDYMTMYQIYLVTENNPEIPKILTT